MSKAGIIQVQVALVACPRNYQDPADVLRDVGGGIVLGECQNGGQGADEENV